MVKTLMLKVCEYNNPNVKFGFVSLDLVLSSRLQNYFGQRLCRINKCMGLESCELETPESRRDKPSLFFAKKCIKSFKHRHLFPAAVHPN